MKMLYLVLKAVLISAAVFGVIALGLIFSQSPGSNRASAETLNFGAIAGDQGEDIPLMTFDAGKGVQLGYRFLPASREDAPLLVFVHGSGWHGGGYQALARAVHGDGDIAVALPDLRGHGPNPQRRGDVDYIGQFEDDLAELIRALRKPGQRVILGGHSSGGGLVIRYAGGTFGKELDAAVLLAPFLKYNAPTVRENSGGWAHPLTRRIIGLSMLNSVGITALNGLPAIEFNFPKPVLEGPLGQTATPQYSYRLNQSFAPRSDYLGDVAKLPPFLLIAGKDDEAFYADQYEPTMAAVTDKGRYELLDGVGHLDVYGKAETAEQIRDFILRKD